MFLLLLGSLGSNSNLILIGVRLDNFLSFHYLSGWSGGRAGGWVAWLIKNKANLGMGWAWQYSILLWFIVNLKQIPKDQVAEIKISLRSIIMKDGIIVQQKISGYIITHYSKWVIFFRQKTPPGSRLDCAYLANELAGIYIMHRSSHQSNYEPRALSNFLFVFLNNGQLICYGLTHFKDVLV